MEKFFYEYKPHLCAALAVYALAASKNSLLLNFSGALFLIGSTCIFYMRNDYRKKHKLTQQVLQPTYLARIKK
jgi:hypothetical protein